MTKPGSAWPDSVGLWPCTGTAVPGTKEVLGADVEVPRTDTEVPAEGVAIAGAQDGGILDERRIRHSGFLSAPY